jgi:hypothetical protein
VGEDLLGVVVRFNHHGAEAGGLDGCDAAADVGGRELRLGYLAWLASFLRDGRFELEGVFTVLTIDFDMLMACVLILKA